MSIVLTILLALHGLIHLLGFVKAFNPALVNHLHQPISRLNGMIWLACSLLFVLSSVMVILKNDLWFVAASFAVLSSQYLIISSWEDARFGSLINVLIVVAVILGFSRWNFKNTYVNEVTSNVASTSSSNVLLTESDLDHLPEVVRKYIRYTGAMGKPKVESFNVEFTGQLRKNEQSEWMPFESEQYNFIDNTTRLFFMKATMNHLPVAGFHSFKNGNAFMDIRLFSLFTVQQQSGKEMGIAETVTFFNDMCCMAPATLIDKRITWLDSDSTHAKASFTNNSISISADLLFNQQGQLTNFISDDRYAFDENNSMKRLRWSTPLSNYREFNGYRLAGFASTIYTYPEGDLCYGEFHLKNVKYNVTKYP